MKTEELKALGLTDEQIDAVNKLNGKDISAEQKKYDGFKTDYDKLKSDYETTKSALEKYNGIDLNDFHAQKTTIANLQKQLTENSKNFETEKFLSAHKFKLPEIKEYYRAKINDEIEKDTNKGKSRSDLFDLWIKDEKGNKRTDLFIDETTDKQTAKQKVSVVNTSAKIDGTNNLQNSSASKIMTGIILRAAGKKTDE